MWVGDIKKNEQGQKCVKWPEALINLATALIRSDVVLTTYLCMHK